jgi:signal transduction histidine kinase
MSGAPGPKPRLGQLTEFDELLLLFIHDVRSHLRAATMLGQMLERSLSATLSGDNAGLFRKLLEANHTQDKFLTKMAEYCRAGEDLQKFGPVAVAVLFDGATQTVRSRRTNLPIEVQSDFPSGLTAPQPLQKVFVELLDNAVKFNASEIKVRVSSRVSETECIIEFVDNGIGFDPAFSQIILQPLKRLHPTSSYPGFGLGLAIAHRIVRGLNGRLWAESMPGNGSTFAISLPISPSS